jgi:WD40 repeat protein
LLGVHHGPGAAIAVSAHGDVASGGVDRLVQLWRSSSESVVIGRHRGAIRALAFSPDGYELVSIADDREAIVWSLAGRPERRLVHDAPVTAVAWLADGTLVTGTRDGVVTWWSGSTSRVLATHRGAVRAIATAGDRIASGGDDGRVGIGDVTGVELFAGHGDLVRALAFAADGRSLASASEDGTVRIWEPTGESRAIALGGWVAGVAIAPDGSVIAVGATGAWSITDELPHDREALQRAIAARVEAAR